VLEHATRLLLDTLGRGETAADERQGVCLDCGAPLPRPEAWGYCDGCGFSTQALRPATLDHPDHREPGEEP
jgi:predicted amidophosphoribosyltransferase